MSAHAPRADGDLDKTLCGLRISHKPTKRSFAAKPSEIDVCEGCIIELCQLWTAQGIPLADAIEADRWPWEMITPAAPVAL